METNSKIKKDLIVKEILNNIIGSIDIEPKENIYESTNSKSNKKLDKNIRPRVRDHITGEFNKIFASASITFMHGKLGQLHCNENRWIDSLNDYKDIYHMIGGKVEKSDFDILYTAIREFVEESNIFMDNELVKNDSIKEYNMLISHLYYDIIPKVKYYDIKVSKYSKLYHRCFMFNINKFSDMNLRKKIINLPNFFSKLLHPDIRIIKELNYLKWIKENKESDQKEFSSLLNIYNDNINNFVY